eukprot:GHVS01028211.1.p1 GENE.GHVS01028211.1~~GHVS01028211.1.p1  ORF type:complete len:449 (+),score=40.43 GHVS01028211.1:78-1424(+)
MCPICSAVNGFLLSPVHGCCCIMKVVLSHWRRHHYYSPLLLLLLGIMLPAQTALADLSPLIRMAGGTLSKGSLDDCLMKHETLVDIVSFEDIPEYSEELSEDGTYLDRDSHSKIMGSGHKYAIVLTRKNTFRAVATEPLGYDAIDFLYGSPSGIKFTVTGKADPTTLKYLVKAMRSSDVCIVEGSDAWQTIKDKSHEVLEDMWDKDPIGQHNVQVKASKDIDDDLPRILIEKVTTAEDVADIHEGWFLIRNPKGGAQIVDNDGKTAPDMNLRMALLVPERDDFRLYAIHVYQTSHIGYSSLVKKIKTDLMKNKAFGGFVLEPKDNPITRRFFLLLLTALSCGGDKFIVDRTVIDVIRGAEWSPENQLLFNEHMINPQDNYPVTILSLNGELMDTAATNVWTRHSNNDLIIEYTCFGTEDRKLLVVTSNSDKKYTMKGNHRFFGVVSVR